MSVTSAIVLFLGCFILATISSALLSHRLDQVGTRLGLSEGLLGLVTAYLPTLFVTAGPMSGAGRMVLWWLLGGTVLATILFVRRAALTRWGGGLLVVGYVVFAGLVAAG